MLDAAVLWCVLRPNKDAGACWLLAALIAAAAPCTDHLAKGIWRFGHWKLGFGSSGLEVILFGSHEASVDCVVGR